MVEVLAKASGDPRFAYDSYRRFIQMFSDVVLGVGADLFEEKLAEVRERLGLRFDYQIPAEELRKLIDEYKKIVKSAGKEFPLEPEKQLRLV